MKLAIFDDNPRAFYPIALTRSVGDIRCGVLKLRQRLQALLNAADDHVIIEERLVPLYKERHPEWLINELQGDTILVNSRLKLDARLQQIITALKPGDSLADTTNAMVALRVDVTADSIGFMDIQSWFSTSRVTTIEASLYGNPADLIMDNKRMIEYDFEQFFYDKENYIETELGVTTLNPYKVWIGEGAVLKPGVILDATQGPIIIDEEAEIMSNAVILGPVYIGKKSKIKIGAKIYEGTSIGPVCKIGGEVEGSIIQAYSNKQHDGFLGHAYLGEWVNLGADTNNSDLKNNYKQVAFYSYLKQAKTDSGYQFLGSIVADHVKTGINCSLNTGVVIGVGCNLWGRSLISDFIPSFSWGEAEALNQYRIDAFLSTAKAVKNRRQLDLSSNETELYSQISDT